jgi:beta-lactamase superfamily II metal-dependent hydrolase
MSGAPIPSSWRVRVRMYCHGLGDCFLLTFAGGGHVLIDCGVLNPNFSRLRAAVEDILNETGGKVDVLVVTHEHWDHISGFTQARGLMDQLVFSNIWVAWTEKVPGDAEAEALHARYDKVKDTLRLVADYPGNPVANETRELLAFFGLSSRALAFSDATREAMDYILARMKALANNGHYCEPGETLEPLGPGVRFHVLGPPRGKLLKKKDPAPGARETYELALASATIDDPESRNTWDYPFETGFKMGPPSLPLKSRLGKVLALYNNPAANWRRIDADWLAGSASLALQMDGYTNNTSLALAIELGGGEVLLFPGDAQVGNWQSWHEVKWRIPGVDTRSLLSNVVFYKAGHHASHNGTLRARGLELMTGLRHVMIPTDEQFALTRNPKGRWQMPAKALYAALAAQSKNSIDRSDAAPPSALYIDWYM